MKSTKLNFNSDEDSSFETPFSGISNKEQETNSKVIKLFMTTETISQLAKCFQCTANIVSYYFSKTLLNRTKFSEISDKIILIRKAFKIFRFFNEIPRMQFLLDNKNLTNLTKNLNFCSRFFSFLFYLLENISLLMVLKIIDEEWLVTVEIIMGLCFAICQTFQVLYYFYILHKTYVDEEELKKQDGSVVKLKEVYLKIKKLISIRFKVIMGMIRSLGELCLAFNDMKLFRNYFSDTFLSFITSLTGFFSALISLWFLIV